jgi:hypothetical protein
LDYILLGSGSTKTPLQKRFKEIDGQLLEKKGLCGRFRHYLVDCSIFPPDYDYHCWDYYPGTLLNDWNKFRRSFESLFSSNNFD